MRKKILRIHGNLQQFTQTMTTCPNQYLFVSSPWIGIIWRSRFALILNGNGELFLEGLTANVDGYNVVIHAPSMHTVWSFFIGAILPLNYLL